MTPVVDLYVYLFYINFFFCSPIVKETVEISTDEESDGAVICHPNGNSNTDGCDEATSGNLDDDSPEGQVTSSVKDPDMEGDTQEDKCVNQDSVKLIDQEKSAPPKSPAKSASSGSERPKRVVPQPFSLSSQRRSSGGNGGVTSPPINKGKSSDKNSISPASMTKKVWSWSFASFSLNVDTATLFTSCFEAVIT